MVVAVKLFVFTIGLLLNTLVSFGQTHELGFGFLNEIRESNIVKLRINTALYKGTFKGLYIIVKLRENYTIRPSDVTFTVPGDKGIAHAFLTSNHYLNIVYVSKGNQFENAEDFTSKFTSLKFQIDSLRFGSLVKRVVRAELIDKDYIQQINLVNSEINDIINNNSGVIIKGYPNPTNAISTISGISPIEGMVNLSVYDVTGKTIFDSWRPTLKGEVLTYNIDLNQKASGIYFSKLLFRRSNGEMYPSNTLKIICLK